MSRRDTIIIALLINISLLAFLFVLAINSDEEENAPPDAAGRLAVEAVSTAAKEPIAMNSLPKTNDEVDNFLKDLSTQNSSQTVEMDEEAVVDLEKETPVAVVKSNENKEDAKIVEVTIKKGDALEKIARNNGTTVDAIKKENNLKSNKLSIGQVLRIPVSSKQNSVADNTQPKPTPTPTAVKKANEPEYYILKSGDSPWKIAKQFHVDFDDLLKLNNIDESKARNLQVGDKIRVR